jgi:hypothetical protein
MQRGIGVFDNLETGDVAADGAFAEQRFTAPAGTRIAAARVWRDVGNRDIYWSNFGRMDGSDMGGESCVKPPLEAFCRVTGERTLANLSAKTLAYGVRCETSYGSCTNGWSLHHVWAIVRSATVTLEDTQPPVVSAPRGELADGAWRRGGGSLVFSAEDNTGVRVRRLVVDGRVRASRVAPGAPLGCGDHNVGDAYTYLQPCAGARGLNGEVGIAVGDVCVWGDGVHAVKAVAVDTGGGEASSAQAATVKVDCTAPTLSVTPGASEVEPGEAVAPAVVAQDAHAGVVPTATQTEVDSGDGVWRPYAGPLAATEGSVYRFRARATDAAGNVSAWSEPSPPVVVKARPVAGDEETPPWSAPEAPPVLQPGPPPASSTTLDLEGPRLDEAPLAPPLVRLAPKTPAAARVKLTTARRLARGRKLRVTGTVEHAPPRSTVLVTVRDATRRVRAKRRVTPVRGTFTATLRLPHRGRRPVRVHAQLRTPDGRTLTAVRTAR